MVDDDVIQHVVRYEGAIIATGFDSLTRRSVVMRIRKKPGRFRAAIAVVALAVGGLAAVPAWTQPAAAAAEDACTPLFSTAGLSWVTRSNDRGVTLCEGEDLLLPPEDAFVQIVDLSAGAKVRMVSDMCETCSYSDFQRNTDAKFNVRSADEWFDWIQSNVVSPAGSRLFSTSNASFFTDASGAASPLSLPFFDIRCDDPSCFFVSFEHTSGWAFAHNEDPAWDSPKQFIAFESPSGPPQIVHFGPFATHYTDADVTSISEDLNPGFNEFDSTVGFAPDFDGGTGHAPRTYVGVSTDGLDNITKVYILNASKALTVGEAQSILESFGSEAEIQLDGGGSTQLFANTSPTGCCFGSSVARRVPNALAVYLAP